MKAAQPGQNLVLLIKLSFECFQRFLGSAQTFFRAIQDPPVFLRPLKIVIDARIVILETITVFAENGFIETGCIGRFLQRRVIVEPLVCKEHFGIYLRHIPLPYDAGPFARRQKECAHKHGQNDIFRNLSHTV